LLLNRFAKIKKGVKGVSVGNLFLQALHFFFDGTMGHLCHFDELQEDQGYRAVVEMPEEQMASSCRDKHLCVATHMRLSCSVPPARLPAVPPVALRTTNSSNPSESLLIGCYRRSEGRSRTSPSAGVPNGNT
jgi:hypothetical protein